MFETCIVEAMAVVLAPTKQCRIIAQAITRACMYLSLGMTVRSEWTYFLRSTWLTSLIYCLTQPCGTCWGQFVIGLNLYSILSENPSLSHHNINTSAGRLEKQRLLRTVFVIPCFQRSIDVPYEVRYLWLVNLPLIPLCFWNCKFYLA